MPRRCDFKNANRLVDLPHCTCTCVHVHCTRICTCTCSLRTAYMYMYMYQVHVHVHVHVLYMYIHTMTKQVTRCFVPDLVPPRDAEAEALLSHVNNVSEQVSRAEASVATICQNQPVLDSGQTGISSKLHSREVSKLLEKNNRSVQNKFSKVKCAFKSLAIVESAVDSLREPNEELCASIIRALVCRFLCQAKLKRCTAVIEKTRERVFMRLSQTARLQTLQQRKLDAVIRACSIERDIQTSQHCFEAWHNGAIMRRAHVARIRTASINLAAKRDAECLHRIVQAWHKVCVGFQSRSKCHRRRLDMLLSARARIQGREKLIQVRDKINAPLAERLIITQDMVEREVSRTIYNTAIKNQNWWRLRHHFVSLQLAVRTKAAAFKQAIKHHRCALCRRIFYPWTEYLHISPLATLHREHWPQPRCYKPRYSQRLVDRFASKHARRYKIRPLWTFWCKHHRALAAGRKLLVRSNARVCRVHWICWRSKIMHRFELRGRVVQTWENVSRQLIARPLRAWYLYTRNHHMCRSDQKRLAIAHARTRERRLRQKLMRAWHHQAIYGRVEGLYTRTELVRSLAELRAHGRRLEARAEAHAAACEEAIYRFEDENGRARRLAARLKDRKGHATQMVLAIHHARTEIDRISSAIECIALLHPSVVHRTLLHLRREQSQHEGMHDIENTALAYYLPFKNGSYLNKLVNQRSKVAIFPDSESSEEHTQSSDTKTCERSLDICLQGDVDMDREVLMLRVRFVLEQAASNFRTFSHFGGNMLYGSDQDETIRANTPLELTASRRALSLSRDDALDQVLKMARDLKDGWQLWDFLINGNVSAVDDKHAIAWKDMEGVAVDIDAKWTPLRANTICGPQRLATWKEFRRAVKLFQTALPCHPAVRATKNERVHV